MRCVTSVTAPECYGAISSFTKTSAVLRKQATLFIYLLFFFLHKPQNEFQGQTVRICLNTIPNILSGIPSGRVYLLLLEN